MQQLILLLFLGPVSVTLCHWMCCCCCMQVGDVPARELVPGDIIEVAPGDRVPADARLVALRTATLRAEQASLTGEPQAVLKGVAPVLDAACELQVRCGGHSFPLPACLPAYLSL